MALTDVAVKNAKPSPRPYKLRDERGLFLEVPPKGNKRWRLRFTFQGKENMLSLGTYPDVSLAQARARRDEARKLLAEGICPSKARKEQQAAAPLEAETFEALGREWYGRQAPNWSRVHADRVARCLEKDIYPWLGPRPIREIEAPELLAVMRRIEGRGAIETAHRALQVCGQVFRYAVACGKAVQDPSGALKGALTPTGRDKHHASLTDPKAIAGLLRAIDDYAGNFATRCALQLAAMTFVRPGELRHAEWAEFDLEAAEWRIPPEKMKARSLHVVPLSRQALAVLAELRPLTGTGKYLFPGERTPSRPMSENTVSAALRRMGFTKDEMTGHGFRSMASTLLNEQGWNRDAIERQLAHAERNAVRAAYNYAEFMPERRRMMQAWADYLDGLKAGGLVTPIRRKAQGE